jgi:hypothetical protein
MTRKGYPQLTHNLPATSKSGLPNPVVYVLVNSLVLSYSLRSGRNIFFGKGVGLGIFPFVWCKSVKQRVSNESNDEQIAPSRTDNAMPTATESRSLQRPASCGEDDTAAVTLYGPRGSRSNAYVPSTSFGGINTRLLG